MEQITKLTHLDGGIADLQLVHSWFQVAQDSQLCGVTNLDPCAAKDFAGETHERLPQDEAVEARGDDQGDLLRQRHPEEHAAEGAAAHADVSGGVGVGDERERLQDGAALEQAVEVLGVDADEAEAELPEVREDVGAARAAGDAREGPEREVEAAEGRDAEDIDGEEQVERVGAVGEDEVLDAIGGEEAEPVGEHRPVGGHVAAGEVDAEVGAPVGGEDAGHAGGGRGQVDAVGVAAPEVLVGDVEEVDVVEDQRRGRPDAAPARGEHGGARRVPGREAGHDVGEQRARKAADAVIAAAATARRGREGAVGCGEGRRGGEAGEDDAHDALHGVRRLLHGVGAHRPSHDVVQVRTGTVARSRVAGALGSSHPAGGDQRRHCRRLAASRSGRPVPRKREGERRGDEDEMGEPEKRRQDDMWAQFSYFMMSFIRASLII